MVGKKVDWSALMLAVLMAAQMVANLAGMLAA
jgi:hypothetical protein